MLERGVIEYCAPTLAGIKSANLFNYHFSSKSSVCGELRELNSKLNEKGVYVEALLWKEASVLIYVYRPSHLMKELQQEGVNEFLASYGYTEIHLEKCLCRLKERLCEYQGFPHEIGVFLGYPLPDVIGFIQNDGKDCKCCGLWKVYCNECETKKLFEKMQKCTKIYLQVFAEGRAITKMTVCA